MTAKIDLLLATFTPTSGRGRLAHAHDFERFTEDMHQLNLESFSTPAGGVVELEVAGAAPVGNAIA